MSFRVTKKRYFGYRCVCCYRENKDPPIWTDSLEEALTHLPTYFPVDDEDGGYIEIEIVDGATGQIVASSKITWPPAYRRGDGYTYTKWSLYIQDDRFIEQVIRGVRTSGQYHSPTPPPPIEDVLIVDKTWKELLDEMAEKKRLQDIAKAEFDLAHAKKQLEAVRGSS